MGRMADAGTIKVGVSLDAGDMAKQMAQAVQSAMRDVLNTVETGMSRVDTALNDVDTTGLAGVGDAATDAMGDATSAVDAGMESVQSSVDSIDTTGFQGIGDAAAEAGAEASSAIGDSAATANSAINSFDTGGFADISSAADGAAASIAEMGSSAGEASSSMGGLGEQAGGIGDSFSGMGKQASGAGGVISGMAGGVVTKLGAVGAAVGGGVAAFKTLKGAIDNAGDTQATEASLTALYGSAEDAADMMGRISDISSGSSIDTGAYNQLAESLGYLGVKGEQGEDIMRNLGKVIVASGGDSSSFDSVSSALTRMQNEGKVTRMTLTQLSNAGVPALDALATKMGTSTDEILDLVTEGGIAVDDVLEVIGDGTGEWMERLIDGSDEVENTLGNTWSRLKSNTMDALGSAMMPVVEALTPALGKLADWVGNLSGAFSGLGDSSSAVGGVFAGIASTVSDMWAQVQPIFAQFWEIITDTIVPALQQFWSDTVQPIFTQVGELLQRVWQNVLQPVFETLATVIREQIMPTLQDLWANVVSPVFTKIGELISAIWEGILQPVFSRMITLWENVLGPVVMWLYQNVFGPAFQGIGEAIKIAWTIISPIMDILIWTINNLGDVTGLLWHGVVEPAWNAIGAIISGIWGGVIKPAWDAMTAGLDFLGGVFTNVWHGVIEPVWNALGDGIRWVWENAVRPAWDAMGAGLDALKGWFQSTVDFIGDIWHGVANIVRVPINFVIDKVYNQGIKAAWDKVAGWLGIDGLPPADPVPAFASGGIYPGYTPGRDIGYIGVSGGEAIMRPEWTRAVGADNVHAMNKAARSGGAAGVQQWLGGHAGGGIPYMGGFFLGGVTDAIKGAAKATWDNTGGAAVEGVQALGGEIKKVAKAGYKKTVEFTFDTVMGAIGDNIPSFGSGTIGKLPREAFNYMSESVKTFLLELAGIKDESRKVDYDPAGGAEQWRPVVEQALQLTGHDMSNIERVLQQINIESSGNPEAINLDDPNAAAGDPSVGLIQIIGDTFARWRDPDLPDDRTDPLANIVAGIRYADAEYGDIANIWPKTMGYATGGFVAGAGNGTSDSILAMLSNGEFVMRASVVDDYLPLLQALNNGWRPPSGFLESLPAFADGGLVTIDELIDFARGVEGQPYDWGGIQWGDCSAAIAAIARFATGLDPFGGRFATSNEREALSEMGFIDGVGPEGSLSVGWFNGGPWGGHTAATLPDGTHFEMGGARGNGQFGGQAAGADDPQFTDHMHLGPDFFAGGDPEDIPGVGDWAQSTAAAAGAGAAAYDTSAMTGGRSSSVSAGGGAALGTTSGTSGSGPGGMDVDPFNPSDVGTVVAAVNRQTIELGGSFEDVGDDISGEVQSLDDVIQTGVDQWAGDMAAQIYEGTREALGSEQARSLAIALGTTLAEQVGDGLTSIVDTAISSVTSMIEKGIDKLGTALITVVAGGDVGGGFYGQGDPRAFWDELVGADIEPVEAGLWALASELADTRGEFARFNEATGRITSDSSGIAQRTVSSIAEVERNRAEAQQKLTESTLGWFWDDLAMPVISTALSAGASILGGLAGAAIGSIIPGAGTAIGGTIGTGLGGLLGQLGTSLLGGLFDEGGEAVGAGLLAKGTMAPERVLSPRQTADFSRLVDALEGAGSRTTVKAPITVKGSTAPQQVQDRLLELVR